ncbi:hypothetical protein ONZ45_g13520 [Pleurotus djamor]|nr:hypothetical protein ONZ45_g13520 [Pleurotus djamor]
MDERLEDPDENPTAYDDDAEYEQYEPSDHGDDEPDDCYRDLDDLEGEPEAEDMEGEEAEELPTADNHFRARTAKLRSEFGDQSMLPIVLETLRLWEVAGVDLPMFLNALSWTDKECRMNARVRYARTSLMQSAELPEILELWHNPPRSKGKGKRAMGARKTLDDFVVKKAKAAIEDDLKRSSTLFLSPPEEFNEEMLASINYQDLILETKKLAPIAWSILESAVCTANQRERNTSKNPDMIALNLISLMQYSRSQRRGLLQKLHSIYFKACGMAARAFDFAHILGFVMSHKWTSDAYSRIAELKMEEVRQIVHKRGWVISHDNVNFPLRVFSQRMHNKDHFVSATAATLWVLPSSAETLTPEEVHSLREHMAANSSEAFSNEWLFLGDSIVNDRIEQRHVHHFLRILLDSPAFVDYPHHDDSAFDPPPPLNPLPLNEPIGQFILKTQEMEEASYGGTMKVIEEFLSQLGLNTEEEQKKLSTDKVVGWLGDQLSVDRLRGMRRFRGEDHNGHDRLDWLFPSFGWFHAIMATANSVQSQYMGTSDQTGSIRQAIDALKRKGLLAQSTKGTFWHDLDELLYHVNEAHARAIWLTVGNVDSLDQLKRLSPAELKTMAIKIVDEFASRRAREKQDALPDNKKDEVLVQWIQWNSDILDYIQLRSAVRRGDVDCIEDLLPNLLFRFAGGGNTKYTGEVLELLQGLRKEWTPEMRKFIKECCWLITRTGKPNSYLPYDLGKEQNICEIKVHHRSLGAGARMPFLTKISPAIPTLRLVKDIITAQFSALKGRGKRHQVPDKEEDVMKLTNAYIASKLYTYSPGRKMKAGPKAEDYITKGYESIEETKKEWFQRRRHPRSREEDWAESGEE